MVFFNKWLLSTYFVSLFSVSLLAQNTIKGSILDANTKDPLISATVLIKQSGEGTIADLDGKFELNTQLSLPITLSSSYTGYTETEVVINDFDQEIIILLSEDAIVLEGIEVKGRRITEREQQSALTVATMDNIAIKETPAANFYDGLGSLKDVDLTAASLGFKIINTRGFNSTSPVRSLQIIDGVDNQSPGLNFSLGNFLGASELDVNRVNLIIGASSAFYGPNAFNGVISMETKNPFLHKGLSVQTKGGERNLLEGAIRWADTFKNKAGHDAVAYKLNFFYLRADDWVADNESPVFDTDTDESNPGGFDAVNIYGDEYQTSNDLTGSLSNPGLGAFHRKGYREVDLVDYDSRNMKASAAVHFRLKPEIETESPELILASNFGGGTTVYQGDNRFSLKNIKFYQHRIELKKHDHYFLRAYVTHEDAGASYDPYFTAILLQERAKNSRTWTTDYINYWSRNIVPQIKAIEGYPRTQDYIGRPGDLRAAVNAFMATITEPLIGWHQEAQHFVGKANPLVNSSDFFEPGTPQFENAFNSITSRISYSEGGTKFFDRSALMHLHGEYKFKDVYSGGAIENLEFLLGTNGRLYKPNSNGSILLDTMGRNIDTYEFGVYGGGTLNFQNNLKVNASLRLDKNENFDFLLSPAASLVYSPNNNNVLRLSFSSAIRNPTLTDQYLFYNVGRAILLGNIDGVNGLITVPSFGNYLNTLDENTLEFFDVDPIRPEKVKTIEAGYRGTLFEKLYVDAGYYFSIYDDFIGYQIGVESDFDNVLGLPSNVQAFRVASNAQDRVTTQGFSIGLNYYFWRYYVWNGNYSWNVLNTATDDPIIPAFNTPEHKFNIGVSGRDIPINFGSFTLKNFGFNINYKWIQGFLFEGSPQFTGFIPSYDLLDAQINWRAERLNTTIKVGASNILDQKSYQTYGGPLIGRLGYISLLYEFKKK